MKLKHFKFVKVRDEKASKIKEDIDLINNSLTDIY